ncbi:MAG: alpha/beta hydrolase [Candidatus Eremiobacteraeota bacterium]|nr:alpha/beta hydrolase [Candidatus Eremiobacteraeota bacterium]
MSRVYLNGVLLALTLAVSFVSAWIVTPAPTAFLLALCVAAIELSPYLLVANIALAATALTRKRSWKAWPLAFSAATLGAIATLFPLLESRGQAPLSLYFLIAIPQRVIVDSLSISLSNELQLSTEVYRPRRGGIHPIVVAVHGGAWQRGSAKNDAGLNRYIASRGYCVFAIDYRQAPKFHFPVPLDDITLAVNAVRRSAGRFNCNPDVMAILGHSAGGELSLLAAYRPHSAMRAVVSYSGPLDLVSGYEFLPQPDPLNVRALLETYLGGTPRAKFQLYREASPLYAVRSHLPATLLIYGKRDHVVDVRHARRMRDALQRAGNDVTYLELPFAEHSFESVFYGLNNRIALPYLDRFLNRTLR